MWRLTSTACAKFMRSRGGIETQFEPAFGTNCSDIARAKLAPQETCFPCHDRRRVRFLKHNIDYCQLSYHQPTLAHIM